MCCQAIRMATGHWRERFWAVASFPVGLLAERLPRQSSERKGSRCRSRNSMRFSHLPMIRCTVWLQAFGQKISARHTCSLHISMPGRCGSTATTFLTRQCPLVATSSLVGAEKWDTKCLKTTPRSSRSASNCKAPCTKSSVKKGGNSPHLRSVSSPF